MRHHSVKSLLVLLALFLFAGPGCAGRARVLEDYAERQRDRIPERSAYVQADFEFWAAAFEPTLEDLAGLKEAWMQHGNAFPDSRDVNDVRLALEDPSNRVVLVALFQTTWEDADLRSKSLGWAVSPAPLQITELSERDVPLRTLMPVSNPWARYFLLRYAPATWSGATSVIVSNRDAKVEIPVRRAD